MQSRCANSNAVGEVPSATPGAESGLRKVSSRVRVSSRADSRGGGWFAYKGRPAARPAAPPKPAAPAPKEAAPAPAPEAPKPPQPGKEAGAK